MELSGHTYIKRAFLERQAAYAGELSGHHFLRQVHGDDALAASLVFRPPGKEQRIAAFARWLRRSQPTRSPLTCASPWLRQRSSACSTAWKPAWAARRQVSRSDGLRIEYPGWLGAGPALGHRAGGHPAR